MQAAHLVLFDPPGIWSNLLPLTYTRPIAALRVGIFTFAERWKKLSGKDPKYLSQPYLQSKFAHLSNAEEDILFINGSILPDESLVKQIIKLKPNESIYSGNDLLAYRSNRLIENLLQQADKANKIELSSEFKKISNLWDIFTYNDYAIKNDFNFFRNTPPQQTDSSNLIIGNPLDLFIDPKALVRGAMINVEKGPVFIGKNAEVMEGVCIRGPLAVSEGSVVKMGAKIYGASTIGPFSKVGGEITNSVIQGYSNKGHDGFLGNSVLGEWCNLGADTNVSNLKNNYSNVSIWNYSSDKIQPSDQQFCGLFMGDHSKCGINTMLNTGTVSGIFCNIFGADFPPKFIPSYSWGGASGFSGHDFEKAMETARKVMSRRDVELTETDIKLYKHIYKSSEKYRK